MNTEDMELALAYWRTMAPQPKAIVYANAIEARLKGIETKEMVIDHELSNAITRGASIARNRKLTAATAQTMQSGTDEPQPLRLKKQVAKRAR